LATCPTSLATCATNVPLGRRRRCCCTLALFAVLGYNGRVDDVLEPWLGGEGAVKSRLLTILALVVAAASWGGLGYLVMTQAPAFLTKLVLFPLLFLAAASLSVPGLAWLRRRIAHVQEPGVVLREAAWVGLYACLVAALQLGRMLNAAVALVLAAIFILLEMFMLQRPERIRRVWYEGATERRAGLGAGSGVNSRKLASETTNDRRYGGAAGKGKKATRAEKAPRAAKASKTKTDKQNGEGEVRSQRG